MISHIKFAALPVFNQDRALAFYRDKFSFEVAQDMPYQGDLRWIELSIPGAQTRLWFSQRENETPGHAPSLIFMVNDLDATHAALVKKGVVSQQPPGASPWNPQERFALVGDTEGNIIMLAQA